MSIKRFAAAFIAGALSLGTLAACGGSDKASDNSSASSSSSAASSDLSGTISAAGATAFQPLVQAAADAFTKDNSGVSITVSGGGSGTGLKQVSDGSVTIGDSDVFAEEKLTPDQAKALVDHQVAISVMAPVVNSELGVTNLTTDQLVSIFTGKTKNWKEVGGPDEEIALITRPDSSGTRATFKKYALNDAEEAHNQALETDDSGTLVQTVSQNKSAIGYVAINYVQGNNSVKTVQIDGVDATLDNVYSGKYKVWTAEHMYTKGDPDAATKAFLDYIVSDTFAQQVADMGYGSASKMTDAAKATHAK
ncbi:MAG: phosphate ABC transporter substrate-binding protein [Actinomycetaceae bacterium]|nr:phosphate ABC transporter substrate-binding protein [Actinomycetaceae bacterium]MDY6082264.1 phosphate ABC transporter substrate-binding protein [Actinomycetaceae bacterium]